ncbi:hypothetical protein AB4254_11330 [Vibrio breoganii]
MTVIASTNNYHEDAQRFFLKLISDKKVHKTPFELSKELLLKDIMTNDSFLACFMKRSDELANALLDQRLWNVKYHYSDDASGWLVASNEVNPNDSQIPTPLRYLICIKAITDVICLKNKKFIINPEYNGITKNYQHLEEVPLLTPTEVFAAAITTMDFSQAEKALENTIQEKEARHEP